MEQWSNLWIENLNAWMQNPFVPEEYKTTEAFASSLGVKPSVFPATFGQEPLTDAQIQNLTPELQQYFREAFSSPLAFGTAGLRGKMGLGLNRMNQYTVATATQGVARWLLAIHSKSRLQEHGVVIGYDTRHHSQAFAQRAASVLAANGIRVHLFQDYCQTPMLAFSIRPLQALAGIMITASHNPKEYNGYKLYGSDGIQIGQQEADVIAEAISLEYLADSYDEAVEQEWILPVGDEMQAAYIQQALQALPDCQSRKAAHAALKIAYTPVHGTGAKLVLPLLRQAGFEQICCVEAQLEPDGSFPTAPAPNPEFAPARALLQDLAEEQEVDLALATDPDADRLSILIPDEAGKLHNLNGNQLGGLLVSIWLELLEQTNTLPKRPALVKSIVTDDFGAKIAEAAGVHTEEALTGFKDICGWIRTFEQNNSYEYVMGYEESIGYALGQAVLDKDGCFAALVLAVAASAEREKGSSLWHRLQELYRNFGYCAARPLNRVREGSEGLELMRYTMKRYRMAAPLEIGGVALEFYEDFLSQKRFTLRRQGKTRQQELLGELDLRPSDVLRYHFADGSWYALRPSGTEPKLKVYIYAPHTDPAHAEARAIQMETTITKLLDQLEEDFHTRVLHAL